MKKQIDNGAGAYVPLVATNPPPFPPSNPAPYPSPSLLSAPSIHYPPLSYVNSGAFQYPGTQAADNRFDPNSSLVYHRSQVDTIQSSSPPTSNPPRYNPNPVTASAHSDPTAIQYGGEAVRVERQFFVQHGDDDD